MVIVSYLVAYPCWLLLEGMKQGMKQISLSSPLVSVPKVGRGHIVAPVRFYRPDIAQVARVARVDRQV